MNRIKHMIPDKKVVIITGSSGFLGEDITSALLKFGYAVEALDRSPPRGSLPDNVTFTEVDLTSDENTHAVVSRVCNRHNGRISSVIHLAAYYDFAGEPSDMYEKLTVEGTRRLLKALRLFDVEQFVFTSTILVHAPCEPGERINEQWPLQPKWDYPESKVKAESVIEKESGTIPTVILRIAGVYNDDCHSIPISNQIQRVYENRLTSHVFPADPSHGQPFLHIDDLVDAVVQIVDNRQSLPEDLVMLLGEPDTYSYEQVQNVLGRLIHNEPGWTTRSIPKTIGKVGAWVQDHMPGTEDAFIKPWMVDIANDHYELDISSARRLIGWSPKHRLITTLPAMVNALKRDPQKWYERHHLQLPEASHRK